jgi:hypothetical protein
MVCHAASESDQTRGHVRHGAVSVVELMLRIEACDCFMYLPRMPAYARTYPHMPALLHKSQASVVLKYDAIRGATF